MVQSNFLLFRNKYGESIIPTSSREACWTQFWEAVDELMMDGLDEEDEDDLDTINDIRETIGEMQGEYHNVWFAHDEHGNWEYEDFHIEFEGGDYFTCEWQEREIFMPIPALPGFKQHSSVVDYQTKRFLTFMVSLKYAKMFHRPLEEDVEAIIILDEVMRDADYLPTMNSFRESQLETYAAMKEFWDAAKAAHEMGYHYLWMELDEDVDLDTLLDDGSMSYAQVLRICNHATNIAFVLTPATAPLVVKSVDTPN